MLTRGVFAMGATLVWVVLLALVSFVVGIAAFGSGNFSTPSGAALSGADVTAIVLRCIVSVGCIGIVSCAAAMAIGSRFSVQASVVVGMSLPFLRQAVGSLPGLRRVFEFTPLGNYYAWTRRLISATEQGSESALLMTTLICVAVSLVLVSSTRWFVAPRVGST